MFVYYKMTKYTGALKSPDDENDCLAESIYPAASDLNLPKTLDLRKDLQPVRNQKKQSSCVGFATSCIKEWQEKKDVYIDDFMSPQFVYNNRSNYPQKGMYGRDAMNILANSGCCLERTYPYGTIESKKKIPKEAYEEASNFKIQSFARVNTVESVKKSLYKDGPCLISFPVYNSDSQFWMPNGNSMQGGHAVAIVGYTKEGFIIRNSWGSRWNGNGYTLYPYEQFGAHWEIWTTVDENSPKPDIKLSLMDKMRRCASKLFN